ncbi:phosphatase 2C-like domain-containing protein [Gautieria morchelliformis]|nr:phosphatase 2C-like domain-containing protein [Gautieria morchelliformis]
MLKLRLAHSLARYNPARFQSTVPPPRPYKFHIGASFAGKPAHPHDIPKDPNAGFVNNNPIAAWRDNMLKRPKTVQSTSAGEDFFYVQEMKNGSGTSFGVADGVGAWVESGIDPSLFSQALCYHAHRYSRSAWAGEPETEPGQPYDDPVEGWELTPQECIELAHGGVLRERIVQAGSSTICVLNVNARTGVLRAANIGDSGFIILRSSNIAYTQPPQTHFFNCPYQLAKLPSTFRRYTGAYVDSPKHAATYSTQLRGGDIIIAYVCCQLVKGCTDNHGYRACFKTDGLADNVYPAEISSVVSLVMRQTSTEEQQAQDLADRLVEYARSCMFKKNKVSPFEKGAVREGIYYRGGKVDDVTVVVAIVEECQ